MIKAEAVNLITKPRLKNELYFEHILDVIRLVETYEIDITMFGGEYERLKTLCDTLDKVLEQVKLSEYTAKIEKLDAQRENQHGILRDLIKASLRDDEEEVSEAATILSHLFKTYGRMHEKTYDEETAAIYNLVEDLQGRYSEQVETLGLQNKVEKLKNTNIEFKKLMNLRDTEKSLKIKDRAVDIRKEIDKCYGNIVRCIEAKTILDPNHGLTPFINELNTNIDRYSNVLAIKAGKKTAKKNK